MKKLTQILKEGNGGRPDNWRDLVGKLGSYQTKGLKGLGNKIKSEPQQQELPLPQEYGIKPNDENVSIGNGITLESGDFGWDYLLVHDNGKEIYVQTDWDYPGIANAFGGGFKDNEIGKAQQYLDDHIGDRVEDPGYFDNE